MSLTTVAACSEVVPLQAHDFELVIFDLDGVLTRTARVHAAAWKQVFDGFLSHRLGEGVRPFDLREDYEIYVDGKPRLAGVRDFLASRGLRLPEGAPEDGPEKETLRGLGNTKNRLFGRMLEEKDCVQTDPSAPALLAKLESCGIRRAVVTSSRNGRRILDAAGFSRHFDTVVDGTDAAREGLAGKPAADAFLAAARIEDPKVIEKILRHLDAKAPEPGPTRLPPCRAPPQARLFG